MTAVPREPRETVIQHGIEWPNDDGIGDPWCARCGSSAAWSQCSYCGGEGLTDDEEEMEWRSCEACEANGGHWYCISGKEWCEAHPMEGRAHIASTAYAKGTQPDD